MRTLVSRCLGSVNLAKRWIGYLREVRRLRVEAAGALESLGWARSKYLHCVRENKLIAAALQASEAAQKVLPKEVVTLLDTARSLIETTATGRALPSFEYHAWLGEYRAYRFNEQQGRHG